MNDPRERAAFLDDLKRQHLSAEPMNDPRERTVLLEDQQRPHHGAELMDERPHWIVRANDWWTANQDAVILAAAVLVLVGVAAIGAWEWTK